jgi:hypothetical protein
MHSMQEFAPQAGPVQQGPGGVADTQWQGCDRLDLENAGLLQLLLLPCFERGNADFVNPPDYK